MARTGHEVAVVLAGGDGRRLEGVARDLYGYPRPKQFCAFGAGGSLVEETLRRALKITGRADRIVASLARAHRREVDECLAEWPEVARVEQPTNRDTAPGLILPVLHVLERDPHAMLYVLPSDHHVSCDDGFVAALRRGAAAVGPDEIALLGAELEAPEEDLGWILPSPEDVRSVPRLAAFVEKPTGPELRAIWFRGAVANTFAMVGPVSAFADLLAEHAPVWWEAARAARDPRDLDEVYATLPPCNLSTQVLQRAPGRLRLARLSGVAWSDVGTPDRLQQAYGLTAK